MSDEERRRGVDPLIFEMHGMLSSLVQKMDDHVKIDDEAHRRLAAVEGKIVPLVDFHESAKTAAKAAAIVGTPVLLGTGGVIWAWLKGLFGGH